MISRHLVPTEYKYRRPVKVSEYMVNVRFIPFVLLPERGEKENETVKVDQYAVSVRPVWQRTAVSPQSEAACSVRARKTPTAIALTRIESILFDSRGIVGLVSEFYAERRCAGPRSNRQCSIKGVRLGV